MALINVVQQRIFYPPRPERLQIYGLLRIKMIIAYESWYRHITPSSLFQRAIIQTLIDKIKLQVAAIRRSMPRDETSGASFITKD